MEKIVYLKPVTANDAEELFHLIKGSSVTETILWDGPISLEELRTGLCEREEQTKNGTKHQFTIYETSSGRRIGSIDVRPYSESYRGDMGLWIGPSYQGKGYGSEAVKQIVQYGFEKLQMEKIEANIFVGNAASRRAFEKNGFLLEGTIRKCAKKRGKFVDEWLFGIIKDDFKPKK
jgi:RimJ/RimL family protein N-acetyltransferase